MACISPCSKQWREQLMSTLLVWAMDRYQEAHIPAMGILWRVAVMQTPVVEPLVKMVTHQSLKAEGKHDNKHQCKEIGGRLIIR